MTFMHAVTRGAIVGARVVQIALFGLAGVLVLGGLMAGFNVLEFLFVVAIALLLLGFLAGIEIFVRVGRRYASGGEDDG